MTILHHPGYYLRHITGKFNSKRLWVLFGLRTLYCFGDSHVEAFKCMNEANFFHRTTFKFIVVGGASAMGMVNPNSRTQALEIFERRIEQVDRRDYLLFMLGEVDCGYVIWYRAEKYNLTVDEQLERSIANYTNFIRKVVGKGYANVIVCSAPLPTISDGQQWGEVANARREVRASLRERTELTQRYNASLRSFCRDMGLSYLDFEAEILDSHTGVIMHTFLNENPLDHHLDSSALSSILATKLSEIGFR